MKTASARSAPSLPNPSSKIRTWTSAARPKTLWAAVAPIVVGSAIAAERGVLHLPALACALAGALLIQIATNFYNDYADFVQGADTEARKGPRRASASGLIAAATMKRAAYGTFALAFASGLYLIARGGWPILVLGVLSIACGILYTAGPRSLAYLGLGDLFVLVFFGPVAVGGTYYVQALSLDALVLVAGLAPGLLAVAILLANNIRDEIEDRAARKRTLVVRLGRRFGVGLYAFCLMGAAAVPPVLWTLTGAHPWVLAASLAVLPAAPLVVRLARAPRETLNPVLGATARTLLLYSVVFAIGWLV